MSWERDRERGYEEQFAHREEVAFKAAAHRNRMLAEWAARRMKLGAAETEQYMKSLVTGDVTHLRGHGIVARLAQDMKAAGVTITEAEVRHEFDRLDSIAKQELRDT
jgi:hypothetical protein